MRVFEEIWYIIYRKGIRHLIPKYKDRTIFTRFFWRTLFDRMKKGFDETALWSLDWEFTKFITPRIKAFTEDYINNPMTVPNIFLEEEYRKSVAKGHKWNSRWHRMEDRRENKRCWKRATNAWINILCQIRDGFEDMKLEEEDWQVWYNKWKPQIDKFNKKLEKAKTLKDKQKLWATLHTWRDFQPGFYALPEDMVYEMRQNAKSLLAKYYDNFWS